jgi:hypothetical protein
MGIALPYGLMLDVHMFSEETVNIVVNMLWIDVAPEFIEGFVEDMWDCT